MPRRGERPSERRKERGMPDVQEVFRMSTKNVGPDPGALDRQLREQRRTTNRRKLGAYGVAAILVGVLAIVALRAGIGSPQNADADPVIAGGAGSNASPSVGSSASPG